MSLYWRNCRIVLCLFDKDPTQCHYYVQATVTASFFITNQLMQRQISMLRFIHSRATCIDVYSDNTSNIILSENDGGFARTRHLIIRRNKAKEAVMSGLIK